MTAVVPRARHTPEIPWDLVVTAIAKDAVGADEDDDEAEGGAP
jgi:hypothetical protein